MNNTTSGRLVLASKSPRRREILNLIGVPFELRGAKGETLPWRTEKAEDSARRLASEKALEVAGHFEDALVLGADTLVSLEGEIFGKPTSIQEALLMLDRLRGKCHQVVTGMALVDVPSGRVWVDHRTSTVVMRSYSREEILHYVAVGEPMDKAGAYAVQDSSFAPAERVEGCYLNVVGLPLCVLAPLLEEEGFPLEVKVEEVAARCPQCVLIPKGRGG